MGIEFDAISNSGLSFGSSKLLAHTTGSGSFRHLQVNFYMAENASILGIPTYGGVNLVFVGMDINTTAGGIRVYLYHLVDPPSGANNISVVYTGNVTNGILACSRAGIDPNNPLGTMVKADGAGGALTVNASSGEGELVIDSAGAVQDDPGTLNEGALQTRRVRQATTQSFGISGGISDEPGQASVTMSWAATSGNPLGWAIVAVPLKPKISELERAVKYFHNVYDPSRAILDNAGRDIPVDQIKGDNYLRTLGILLPTAKVYSDLIENPEVGYIEVVKTDETKNTARIKAGKESLLETFLSRLAGRGV